MLSEGLENIPCFIILPDVPKQFEGYASHEARCRMAACTRQPAGNRTRPASRGTCRATAVTRSQPAFPQAALRASGAQSGVKGGERKRVPSGHNRRRRLATGSRQPKRGFGTAVPKTTIEVADHYPCSGEDAAEVFAGLLGGVDQEAAHVQLDGLARFNADALVGIGNDS